MIAYLPEIYPDELVYSWFARYAVHSGYISNKQVLQVLYCKKSDTPIKEFIGNLNPEVRDQIDRIYPLKELVLNHTMHPQYARFIPLEQKKDALHKLCYENCDVHHLFSVLPRCEKEQYLKYCPVCVKKDRVVYGETYWHRKHQIRNIGICPKHECKLKDSNVMARSMNIYTFTAAEIIISDSEEILSVENPLQIEFAKYMEQIFDFPMNFEYDVPISSILYHGMKNTEYMKAKGNCRFMTKFVNDIQNYYKHMELNEIASMNRIQRTLLSGNRYDFSLICQVAFFLKIPVKELIEPVLTEEDIKQEKNSHYIKGNIVPDWEKYDTETEFFMDQIASGIYYGSTNEMGKPEKVTEKNICKRLGIKQHQLEKMPKCRKVLEKYYESYPESWTRKLVWAYAKLQNEKKKVCWTDIRKLSGVKKDRAKLTIPYLKKYVDSDVEKAIVSMLGENCSKEEWRKGNKNEWSNSQSNI